MKNTKKTLRLPSQDRLKLLFDYRDDGRLVRRSNGKVAGKSSKACRNQVMIDGTSYLNSRLVWAWHHGDSDMGGLTIDHINKDRNDDRIDNLRLATVDTQVKNKKARVDSPFGVTGIHKRDSGNYRVVVNSNKKRKNIGTFKTFDEALAARNKAFDEHGFDKLHGLGY